MRISEVSRMLATPRKLSPEEVRSYFAKSILGLLRHQSTDSTITHDQFGFVDTDVLVRHFDTVSLPNSIKERQLMLDLTLAQLVAEERVEFRGPKVRALYGHSLSGVLVGRLEWPTQRLLHVTRAWQATPILWQGLKRRRRSYVHLTTSFDYALKLFEQHPESSLFLEVDPEKVLDDDVFFRKPNSHVWLANRIPPDAIRRTTPKKGKRDFANQT